ncbi:MAG: ABC transporter substrate-binding protein [Candidatus Binataceae bacterium]
MRTSRAAALVAVLALAASACHVNRPKIDHASEQVLYSVIPNDPRSFNPILVTDETSALLLEDVFETLTRINYHTLLPDPRVASSWEISKDEKTVTFHLRHDVRWFDGQPLTARDVLFTLKVVYDPKTPTSIRSGLLVDGKPLQAAAPDDYTLVVTMPRPFAPLLFSLGSVPIIPEHALRAAYESGAFNHTWGIDTPPEKIIGASAYKLTRYVPSQVAQFVRNPDFFLKDEHGGELPRLHGRTRLVVQDRNAAYLRFLSGQTDIYAPRPQEVVDLRDQADKLNITVKEIGPDTAFMFFCFNRNPRYFVKNGVASPKLAWFTDLNFLRAMAHAIDKQGIIDLCFHGLATPAVSDLPPANKLYYNPNLKDYDYDLAESARLLEAGGYHLVAPGVRVDSKGNPLQFNLATYAQSPELDRICVIYKQDLESLGIKVNYRPLDFNTLVEKLDTTFDWDCILMLLTTSVDPNDGANFYRSSGNLHLWNPNQPKPATPWEGEIDTLMDQGASVMDPARRAPYYWKIQQIIHDQLAVIVVVRTILNAAWRNTLENYEPTVWGELYKPEWIQFKPE